MPPSDVLVGEQLRLLHALTYFDFTTWQVGDRGMLAESLTGGAALPSEAGSEASTAHAGVGSGLTSAESGGAAENSALAAGVDQTGAVSSAEGSRSSRRPRRGRGRRNDVRGRRSESRAPDFATAVLIVAKATVVDVLWQARPHASQLPEAFRLWPGCIGAEPRLKGATEGPLLSTRMEPSPEG